MKKFAVACLLLFSLAAFSQEANTTASATTEDVQQFFQLVNTRRQIDNISNVMAAQIPQMTESMLEREMPDATPEQVQLFRDFVNKSVQNSLKSMPIEEMMKAMIPVYQKHFTHSDMQQLIGFYRTPVGKKFLDEMPSLTSEGMTAAMPIIQTWSAELMAKNQEDAAEFARKLKAQKPTPKTPEKK